MPKKGPESPGVSKSFGWVLKLGRSPERPEDVPNDPSHTRYKHNTLNLMRKYYNATMDIILITVVFKDGSFVSVAILKHATANFKLRPGID